MSKEPTPKDWEKLWLEYNKSLKSWMQAFESLQKATKDVQSKYNDVMAKALKESSDKSMNQFTENWQKSMSQAGIDTFNRPRSSFSASARRGSTESRRSTPRRARRRRRPAV